MEFGRTLDASIDISEFPEFLQQRYSDELANALHYTVKENFEKDGYKVTSTDKRPFDSKKGLPGVFYARKEHSIEFKHGEKFGTRARLWWKENDLSHLQVEVLENPEQLNNYQGLFATITICIFYAATLYYWMFWIAVLVMAFICFILVILLAVVPCIAGLFGGAFIGAMVYRLVVRGEVLARNENDRKWVMLKTMELSERLRAHYRANFDQLLKTPYPLPVHYPAESSPKKEDWWWHLHLPH